MHFLLLIVNKHGSLSYTKVFSDRHKFNPNEFILLGSTFHSMHAISSQVTPPCQIPKEGELQNPNILDGITEFICDSFTLKSLQTQTGVKIVLVSDHNSRATQDQVMHKVDQAYADFVSKNPFQPPDQPIQSDLFDSQIMSLFPA